MSEATKHKGWAVTVALAVPVAMAVALPIAASVANGRHLDGAGVMKILAGWAPAFEQLGLVVLGGVALASVAALGWSATRRWSA